MLVLLLACHGHPDGHPLGMTLEHDGVVYAGAANVDLTPVIAETYTDLNGNFTFDGCLDNPTGVDCPAGPETFDDVDGDGWFDATFIGGFGPMRPANGIHDPITARAFVLAQDGEYIAFVSLDLVGLGTPPIHEARDRIAIEGFDPDHLIVQSTHNHQGPDAIGLWGNPYDLANPVSGRNPEYQARIVDAIEAAVRQAAGSMVPVDLKIGRVAMRDRSQWFNGVNFGGKNPTATMHGMVHDIRDPIVVSDQLLVLQGVGSDGNAVFTWTNWSGHPETRGGDNDQISSDWIGVERDVLEAEFGGVAIHSPECLGGMQSALGGDLPLVDPDGTHVMSGVQDADGDDVPVWAEHDSWEFITSHGWHIAEAAIDALDTAETVQATPIRVETEPIYVPIENIAYKLLGPKGMFDLDFDDAITDTTVCPEAADGETGCIPTRTSRIQVGSLGLVSVPGELLPEVAWGFPADDPQWDAEVGTPAARGPGATYFPQSDPDCVDIPYETCRSTQAIGDCDCLSVHASPYVFALDPAVRPLLDGLDTPYKAALSMTDNYMSYIVPEPDFNTAVNLLSANDGDHYEDTVSPSKAFATRIQAAQQVIDTRW
jgi:hypothetical protein